MFDNRMNVAQFGAKEEAFEVGAVGGGEGAGARDVETAVIQV
jgi:hypothetical protein